eukprot:gene25835-32332_t
MARLDVGVESSRLRVEKALLNLRFRLDSTCRLELLALDLKESHLRVTNLRQSEVSRKAMQKRWLDNHARHEKSFELRQQNEENVLLRKIYQGLLLKMTLCKREEEKEAKEKRLAAREQISWQIESLNGLFEERVRRLEKGSGEGSPSRIHGQDIRDENLRTSELLHSIIARNDAVLSSMKSRLDQKRDRESTVGGSDYWANNIRKEYRNVNADQIAFCDTFKALLVGLMAYVKEFHTTGLAWNAKGIDVSEFSETSSAATEKVKTAAAPVVVVAPAAVAVPKADLFAALNKDAAVTSGLKKVTKDMQTWRSEYKTGDGPTPVVKAAAKPVAAAASLKGPAKLEFQAASSKWLVEYQTAANGTINVAINDKKETVYIFGCVGATVDIKGKCKSIVVDGCKQVKVYFDSAMASCEVVNCQRMQVHCREVVPAVAIDKTDGIVVFLPVTSLTTEIVASKSSEMNVTWPDENGDLIERPIPEQYVHRIKGTTVTADVSDLYLH